MPRKKLTDLSVAKLKLPDKGKQLDYFDAGMPGLVLRVNYGGSKVWRALYYVSTVAKKGKKEGQRIKMPTTYELGRYPHLKLKDAREKARQFLADPQKAKAQADTGSFKEVAENFIKRHVEAQGLRTRNDIVRLLNSHIYPHWQHRPFREIRRGDVAELLDHIEDKHGARQADVVLAIVRKMMNWYARRNDDYVSPIIVGMGRYKPKDHERDTIIGKLVDKNDDYNDDEIRAFWSACDGMKGKSCYGDLVKALLLSAQRKEKVATMRRDAIINAAWTVPTEDRQKGTGKKLRLPQLLLDIIEAQPKIEGNPYVFPGTRSGRRKSVDGKAKVPPEPPTFNSFSQRKEELDLLFLDELHKVGEKRNDQAMLAYVAKVRALLKARAAAKGDARDELTRQLQQIWWVTHDLRHTAKSLMRRAGVSKDISERVLGHAIGGVEGTYDQHDYNAEKADALQRLAALIETILNPPEGSNVVALADAAPKRRRKASRG